MFRSKGFTAAFISLSVVIAALLFVFIYLVSGVGRGRLEKEMEKIAESQYEEAVGTSSTPETSGSSESAETTTTEAPTTTEPSTEAIDTEIRALKPGEPHNYPLINELIDELGVLSITKPGDSGEGLVFHALPQFDDPYSEGNVIRTAGSFDTLGKIFILDNDRPFLMYYTSDELFVTSSPAYVSYKNRVGNTIAKEAEKVGSYGYDENTGIVAVVYAEDGDHVAFSLFDYDASSDQLTPVLPNIIGAYSADGTAYFEYHGSDGNTHVGTLVLTGVSDSAEFTRQAHFRFDEESPVRFKVGAVEEMYLHY